MSTIQVLKREHLAQDYPPGYNFYTSREQAFIETVGWRFDPSLVKDLQEKQGQPRQTVIVPLKDDGNNRYVAKVTVHGYSLDSFLAIIKALGEDNFKEYNRLITELVRQDRAR